MYVMHFMKYFGKDLPKKKYKVSYILILCKIGWINFVLIWEQVMLSTRTKLNFDLIFIMAYKWIFTFYVSMFFYKGKLFSFFLGFLLREHLIALTSFLLLTKIDDD